MEHTVVFQGLFEVNENYSKHVSKTKYSLSGIDISLNEKFEWNSMRWHGPKQKNPV